MSLLLPPFPTLDPFAPPEMPPLVYGPREELVLLPEAGPEPAVTRAAPGGPPPPALSEAQPPSAPKQAAETGAVPSGPAAAPAEPLPGDPPPAMLPEEPPTPAPAVGAETALSAPAGTAAQPAVAAAGAPPPTAAEEPPFLVPEDAFPTIEELDAILAASAEPPQSPDAATRAEVIAALGLDPSIADDPGLFLATMATLAPPEPDPMPECGLSAPETLAWPWGGPQGDWLLA